MIYPEGCSTNGIYLIKFKKGAFASLRPVKPHVNKFWNYRCNMVEGAGMYLYWYSVLLYHTVWTSVTCHEMPVFAPNDYFWENHWDGKEDKAQLYADTVR